VVNIVLLIPTISSTPIKDEKLETVQNVSSESITPKLGKSLQEPGTKPVTGTRRKSRQSYPLMIYGGCYPPGTKGWGSSMSGWGSSMSGWGSSMSGWGSSTSGWGSGWNPAWGSRPTGLGWGSIGGGSSAFGSGFAGWGSFGGGGSGWGSSFGGAPGWPRLG
ncbi:hypothetical protein Fcan01_20296, partial [Folsomia candida]